MPARTRLLSRSRLLLGGTCLAIAATGCQLEWPWTRQKKDIPDDAMVLRGQPRADHDTSPDKVSGALGQAHDLFRQSEWSKAEKGFHEIAENKKNSPSVAEEARYYEAECIREQGKLPSACDTYMKMLHDFPSGAYKEQAVRRVFDIAMIWLGPTDTEMAQYKEKIHGERTFVMPALLQINATEKSMPMFDSEGRALQALEVVHYSDITGPLAAKALFLCGYVKFYREDYLEADHYFTQLIQMHKDSSLTPQAIELDIVCKTLATGGPDYDGRKAAEARMLIDTAMKSYPSIANDKEKVEAMTRQIYSITALQAEKDIHRAEFYERTGHPGSAYFMYEIVRRRNPGTKYETIAVEQMKRLHSKMEEDEQHKSNGVVDLLDEAQKRWNRLWNLESPLEKSEEGKKPDTAPPVGDRQAEPSRQMPSSLSGPGAR